MFKLVEKYADKDEAEWPALFHRILQSRIRDWYRRNTVRNRFRSWLGSNLDGEQDPMQSVVDEAGRSPEIELQNDRSMAALEVALERLEPKAREVIYLRSYDGLSYELISQVLGISEQAINGRLRRAKKELAKHLRRAGFGEVQI